MISDTLPAQAVSVFLGIFVILSVASLSAVALNRSRPGFLSEEGSERIFSWWWVLAALLLVHFFDRIGAVLLFFGISFAALREFMTLAYRHRSDHNAIAVCFYILLPLQYYFVFVGWYGMYTTLIPIYALLVLPVIVALSGEPKGFIERTAKIQWGLMGTVFCISYIPALMTLDFAGFDNRNIVLLIFMILVVQISDTLQCVFSRFIGEKTLLPELSGQTVAGTLASIACSGLVAALLYRLTPFSPFQAALTGLVIATAGFCGNIVMTAVKQGFRVKSWHSRSNRMGILDRTDNLCFAAPVFFHIVRYFAA